MQRTQEMPPIEILFVCLGNICRSPSAEGVMKAIVEKENLSDKIVIDSAGILNYHEGNQADSRMREHAQKRGYNLTSISRQVTQEDFERFDLIIGMDDQNINDLHAIAPHHATNKISRMTDYLTSLSDSSVPDPYYGGAEGFEYVLDLLEDACEGLLHSLKSKL